MSIVPQYKEQRVRFGAIVQAVAHTYGMTESELKSKSNTKRICVPRQVVCYLARRLTPLSFPQIGRLVGGQHYTTVQASVKKIRIEIRAERKTQRFIEQIERDLIKAIGPWKPEVVESDSESVKGPDLSGEWAI